MSVLDKKTTVFLFIFCVTMADLPVSWSKHRVEAVVWALGVQLGGTVGPEVIGS